MSNGKALVATIATFLLTFVGAMLLWDGLLWVMTDQPNTYTFHVEYGANEDMFECPGTPDRVVEYTPLPDGAATYTCHLP